MSAAPLARLRHALPYRWAPLWRWMAAASGRRLPRQGPPLPVRFVTFGGAAHLGMMSESLVSLARSWGRLPSMHVVLDSGTDPRDAARALRWWPGSIEVTEWRALLPAVGPLGQPDLVRFAEREPMGRKLVAVAANAAAGPTLYSDVDVLWFRRPPSLDRFATLPGPAVIMSPDVVPAYDDRLVPGRLPQLANPPFRCAGLAFAIGDFLSAPGVRDLLHFAAEAGIGLTEQTILAECDRQLAPQRWAHDEIVIETEDRHRLDASFVGQPWAARHYVGQVRHLFWRDAAALRLRHRHRNNE